MLSWLRGASSAVVAGSSACRAAPEAAMQPGVTRSALQASPEELGSPSQRLLKLWSQLHLAVYCAGGC